MKIDSLGNRMKGYENITRNYLTRRMPTLIRLDGVAFHTFTRGFKKPFDDILMEAMWETTKYLCANIQGCKVGYTQSDEISLLLTDYENIDTCSWFDSNIQKMVSISASMATLAFNKAFTKAIEEQKHKMYLQDAPIEELETLEIYERKIMSAMFDSRAFSIPKEEVCNYFIWRQQDATRNSIQMVGRANFSHKQLNNKSCNEIQEMLFQDKNLNWNDIPTYQKRGACIVKKHYIKENSKPLFKGIYFEGQVERSEWVVDKDIPIFTQNREYIERYL